MINEKIAVLDFGGQYTQLIAKAVRKNGVFSEIVDCATSLDDLVDAGIKGIILSGGPDSVYEDGAPTVDPKLFDLGIPVLGICYGMQLTNELLGGSVSSGGVEEYGKTDVSVDDNLLFSGLDEKIIGWMSHGDSVGSLAPGFRVIAETEHHVAAIANDERRIYGVQFHPEVTHTPQGLEIVSNFVHNICGCGNEWTMGSYIEQTKDYIKETVGMNDTICFVSGGVDSSFVAAVLAQTEGIGNVHYFYIDALMRKNETEEVAAALESAGVEDLQVVRAQQRFIDAVAGMQDPEQKRKAIGNLFGKIMEEECERLGLDSERTFLAQGTLYTDLIESGRGVGKKAATIKSHHNVGCKFIDDLKAAGRVVEPNRMIFKDEVRAAAREIGLPPEISERQPYPGPGLGIRIVQSPGVDEGFYTANEDVRLIASTYNFEGRLLPIRTVGVQGDERTYSYLTMLQGPKDWDLIRAAADAIPQVVKSTNRVVYRIGQGDLDDVITKIVPATVTAENVALLQEVDYIGRQIIAKHGMGSNQDIFALIGVDINGNGKPCIVYRGVDTDDFMTVTPVVPDGKRMSWDCLREINNVLKRDYGVAMVFDVTTKPPATTCLE